MTSLTAVVLGGTGLIGEQLVKELLNDDAFAVVRVLVRRQIEISHPKLQMQLVDFGEVDDFKEKLGKGDYIFCCIGTTQSKVKGDKNLYRKIDFDIPVQAAIIGKEAGFTKYLLVSSVGADAASGNFYLKLKGEVEQAIAALNLPAFHIFRPGLLLGKRKEFRFGELLGKLLMSSVSFLLQGKYKKYRGIHSIDVARAMVHAAKMNDEGMFSYDNSEIKALSKHEY